jgi:hypothetical protein
MDHSLLISLGLFFLTVKIKAVGYSEKSADFYRATKICISEESSISRIKTL